MVTMAFAWYRMGINLGAWAKREILSFNHSLRRYGIGEMGGGNQVVCRGKEENKGGEVWVMKQLYSRG